MKPRFDAGGRRMLSSRWDRPAGCTEFAGDGADGVDGGGRSGPVDGGDDHAGGTDDRAGAVEKRSCDTGFAEDGLVALGGQAGGGHAGTALPNALAWAGLTFDNSSVVPDCR